MRKTLLTALAAALLLAACGGGNGNGDGQSSTSSVIRTSASLPEDTEPFVINNDAFAFNDTSESGEPVAIN